MLEKELSLKGWNWGTAKFNGAVLSFNVGSKTAFEIPLNNVSQCNTGKNEVVLEFHQVYNLINYTWGQIISFLFYAAILSLNLLSLNLLILIKSTFQNDDTPVSLMEMRFHIPTSEMAGDLDPVDAFHQQVMNKASVISVSGDAIAIFRELQCLTPR